MKENTGSPIWRRRALALVAASLLGTAAFWASASRIASALASGRQYRDNELPPWREGYLDIHHLQVGACQSTFVVMPDGSTLLIDAGDLEIEGWEKSHEGKYSARGPVPNSTRTTAGWIVEYLRRFWPVELGPRPTLDFVLVTHFHKDHIGDIEAAVKRGAVKLHGQDELPVTGLSEVAEAFHFAKLIDRAYPDYDFPVNLFNTMEGAFYIGFMQSVQVRGTLVERFEVAKHGQLRMVKGGGRSDFVIKNIKTNAAVAEVDAHGNFTGARTLPGEVLTGAGKWDENKLSIAMVIEYGSFRYYEGGDNEANDLLDAVNPTAQVVGPVDVATLNHHGQGVTKTFAELLDPKVAILQAWCSSHPPSRSIQILREEGRGQQREIFATDMFTEKLAELEAQGLAKSFRSVAGHVVVRVHPKQDDKQSYEIFVLDPSSLSVLSRHHLRFEL